MCASFQSGPTESSSSHRYVVGDASSIWLVFKLGVLDKMVLVGFLVTSSNCVAWYSVRFSSGLRPLAVGLAEAITEFMGKERRRGKIIQMNVKVWFCFKLSIWPIFGWILVLQLGMKVVLLTNFMVYRLQGIHLQTFL